MEYKGYRVESLGTFSLVRVLPKGSGSIPAVLEGLYTSPREATVDIDRYLASLKKGKNKNGKEESTATS